MKTLQEKAAQFIAEIRNGEYTISYASETMMWIKTTSGQDLTIDSEGRVSLSIPMKNEGKEAFTIARIQDLQSKIKTQKEKIDCQEQDLEAAEALLVTIRNEITKETQQ